MTWRAAIVAIALMALVVGVLLAISQMPQQPSAPPCSTDAEWLSGDCRP